MPDPSTAPIDYERLYEDVLPSVVSIYVSTPDPRRVGGAGSGFVYDESGHVVTNQHVVGDADRVEVRFARGDWRVRVVTRTLMTSTAESFRIRAMLDAFEGESRVFSKTWDREIPRDLV